MNTELHIDGRTQDFTRVLGPYLVIVPLMTPVHALHMSALLQLRKTFACAR